MSRTFRFLYWRVCCVMCTTRKKVMGHHHHHHHHHHQHHHHHHHHHHRQHQEDAKVRRRCRTSIRAPGMKVGPRHSLKFRFFWSWFSLQWWHWLQWCWWILVHPCWRIVIDDVQGPEPKRQQQSGREVTKNHQKVIFLFKITESFIGSKVEQKSGIQISWPTNQYIVQLQQLWHWTNINISPIRWHVQVDGFQDGKFQCGGRCDQLHRFQLWRRFLLPSLLLDNSLQ